MNRPPTVSVVIPNFNHGPFLVQRIESVLQQTFTDIEVIILDDASTDNSEEVIARYLSDARVTYYRNARNSGSPFVQWNRGVALARGEFVWIAESDDFAEPTLLVSLVEVLRASPRVVLAYCNSLVVDSKGKTVGDMLTYTADLDSTRWRHPFINNGHHECQRYLVWKNTIPNASAVLFRRSAFLASGGAPEELRLTGDWMTWARILCEGEVAYTEKPLNYFRQHDSTVRAATSERSRLQQFWQVQHVIATISRVDAVTRRNLAVHVVAQVVAHMRTQRSTARLSTLVACLPYCGRILMHAPRHAARAIVREIVRIKPADARSDACKGKSA
jgi:hypothetical protein